MANNGIGRLSCVDTFINNRAHYKTYAIEQEDEERERKKKKCNVTDGCERPKCEEIKETVAVVCTKML